MHSCLVCGTKIDEKYKYCVKCNTQNTKSNALQEIARHLKQINWNLGLRNEFVKQQDLKLWAKIEKSWKEKREAKEKEENKGEYA